MELPLSDHVRGLDPSQGRLGRMERLEAKHRARDPLYEAVVLFNQLVAWFADFGEEASPDMLKVAFNAA